MSDEVTRTRQVTLAAGTPRRAYLDVVSGAQGLRFALDRNTTMIGRTEEADLRLDVDGVSRRHARILRSGPLSLSLVDLGAKNGTFLNGGRIDVAALHHGDQIQIGPVTLAVSLVSVDTSRTAAPTAPNQTLEPASGAGPLRAQLSPREWEVASHVARGLTNAQIGTTLGIGKRTVATHLERIYERLGIHSRAVLARMLAVESSL